MSNPPIDISILGKILLSEFEELNSNKFQLAVIFSLMNGRPSRIYNLNGRVFKLFKNKKRHSALFRLKIDEAINWLISNRVLIRFGKADSFLKLSDNYLETFNKLKREIDSEGVSREFEMPIFYREKHIGTEIRSWNFIAWKTRSSDIDYHVYHKNHHPSQFRRFLSCPSQKSSSITVQTFLFHNHYRLNGLQTIT